MKNQTKFFAIFAGISLVILFFLNCDPKGSFGGDGLKLSTNESNILDSILSSTATNAPKLGEETNEVSNVVNITLNPGDPAINVKFFGLSGEGTKFVYLADNSGSMSGRRHQRQKEELIRSIKQLKEGMYFTIIFYDSILHFLGNDQNLRNATPSNISAAVNWIRRMSPTGGTNMLPALTKAIEISPDTIFLLSDGVPNSPEDVVIQTAKQLNKEGAISINTICLENATGERLMRTIANQNNGEFRVVN